ncbi:MAG: sugar ABC transporter substrate-binding protein [Casimicrobiaceae bacterium]
MLTRHFRNWVTGICCAAFAALGHAQPKPIELEFPSWQIEEAGAGEYWTELIKAFEAKNPNVKIKKQQVPFREYVDKLTVRFAGNNPPDIVHLPTRNYLAFASQGWLAPLDEYLAQTDVKATYMKLNDEMLYNGKYYGVLMMGYGMMFFYNDKLLADAKVGVPKTSDELLKAIAAATDVNAGRFGYGAPTNEHPNVFVEISTWVTGEGASLFKGNQYNFTDPAVIRAIDRFRTAVKGAPKGTSSEQARQLFIDGKIAMIRDGPWVAAQVKKAPEATRANLKMGMMPFAAVPGGTSNSLHMPAKLDPEKKKLVWEFIRMTTTPEWQAKFTLLTSSPAPRKNALPAAEMAARPDLAMINKSAAEAVNLFPEGITVRENYNEFAKIFVESGMKLMTSERPTVDIMKDLQAEMNKRIPVK